jgi:hypothetical protein
MMRVLVLSLVVPAVGWSQQLLVFPVVTDELPGLHGSLWVTNVRLVKVDPTASVTVRRVWVCLEDGGFAAEPGSALTWSMNGDDWHDRVLVLEGGDLLQGGGPVGAVGLEIEGGELIAHAYIADVRYGDSSSGFSSPWAFGQGQLAPAIREPLVGPSHIPWLGGCLNNPCSQEPPERWDYLRNNIGVVNPNPEPMTFEGTVIPFGYWGSGYPGATGEIPQDPPETFTKIVPAYGWLQFRWEASRDYSQGPPFYASPPANGFIVSLTPDSDLPYYAYASVVFTPDPASGGPEFNDPMFVAAEPGFIALHGWGQPGAQGTQESQAPATEEAALE